MQDVQERELMTRAVLIRMPESMYNDIEKAMEEDDIASMSAMIRILLREGIHNRKVRAEMENIVDIETDSDYGKILRKIAWIESHVAALKAEAEIQGAMKAAGQDDWITQIHDSSGKAIDAYEKRMQSMDG